MSTPSSSFARAAHRRARRLRLLRSLALVVLASAAAVWVGARAPTPAGADAQTTVPPANPMATLQRDSSDEGPLVGRVEQRLNSGSYSYLALRVEAAGPAREPAALRWAVTLGKGEPIGTRVRVRSFGHSAQFYSRRLKRTFPNLVFGIVSRQD